MKAQNLVVISSYPPKNTTHDKHIVGIASYAKNTLTALRTIDKKNELNISVLAEKLPAKSGSEKIYIENGINISRVWERNSFKAFPLLIKELLRFHKNTKNVLIELELSMFGNLLHLAFFPLFVILLRVLGKKVTIVFHQIIPDIKELYGHINIDLNDWRINILNILIRLFYVLVLFAASKAIVFDEALKHELKKFGNGNKISVIPHGVETFNNPPTKKEARMKLNISPDSFVLLCFGFIAWYKGTDWLIQSFKQLNNERIKHGKKPIDLIIAGGKNPNHANKKYYQQYIGNIEKECRVNNIRLTGFVEEKDIPLYFQACNAVVLPYRAFMSASGPLSFAMAFNKPFLVSDKLAKIFETKDMKDVLDAARIKKELLTFSLGSEFKKKINLMIDNLKFREKIADFSKKISLKRSWKYIGKLYYEELNQQK